MNAFDAIVIGGGHNGLVCAAYLGLAGQRVAVIEARPILGGFTTSEHPFSNHPEVTMPMAAMDLATANMPPSIIDALDMRAHGLQLIDVDPFYSYVGAAGESVLFWRDLEKTCAEIAVLSPADAQAYRAFTTDMISFWRTIAPYMQAHPLRPGLTALAKMAWRAAAAGKRLGRAARILMMSPKAVIESLFRHAGLQAAFANFAAAAGAPLDQPGSGIILALMAMQHEWGVVRPQGGMGEFANTLAAIGAKHNVTHITGQPVREIIIENGRARGVRLANGEQMLARNVIGAIDPKSLMQRLLPSRNLPEKLAGELAGLGVAAANIGSARLDLLLHAAPHMLAGDRRAKLLLPTSMLIGPPTLAATQAYIQGCTQGELGEDIPVWAASPSMLDRSLTPTPEQQCLYVYIPAVPYRLANAQPWSERRDELGDKIIRQLETVMPGLQSLILARAVRTPEDIESTSGIARGCAYHVDMSLAQMGPWRPTPSLAGYRTPIPGLWHTGAGAHPMGSVNGISGRLAAQTVLRAGRA